MIRNKISASLSPVIIPLIALILVGAGFSLTTPSFLTTTNLFNIALQGSIISIVAIGATFVIMTAQIDLSPGSLVALMSMILATFIAVWKMPVWLAVILLLVGGAIVGLANGVLSTYVRIPSFIATLAGFSAFSGIAFMFNNGSPYLNVSSNLEKIFYGHLLGLPIPFVLLIIFYAAGHIWLNYTVTGRSVYAVGGNENAASLSGIRVFKIKIIVFVIAGVCATIGAILSAAELNSGSASLGNGFELQAIAAVVVGGTDLFGGSGSLIATLLGSMTIVIVGNGLDLHSVPSTFQKVALGIIIALAVGLQGWRGSIGNGLRKLRRHTNPPQGVQPPAQGDELRAAAHRLPLEGDDESVPLDDPSALSGSGALPPSSGTNPS